MYYINLPDNKSLMWYLAAEEYYAHHLVSILAEEHATEECAIFFTWIVPPTVIFGRHQVMENEVNVDFCKKHGIAICQRKSGGGCVYSDQGNLMISYISANKHSQLVFQKYLDLLSLFLQSIGYDAVKSTHNDIMVGKYKVSGNACFTLPEATIVHGTLMYDVDFEMLQHAITPSGEKLAKHGVDSVRQRVANLKNLPHSHMLESIDGLRDAIISAWMKGIYDVSDEDIRAIDQIVKNLFCKHT